MVNMTVIHIKDLIKYLIRIVVAIAIFCCARFFYMDLTKNKENITEEINQKTAEISNYNFISCINSAMPISKYVIDNQNVKTSANKSSRGLNMQRILNIELGMLDSFIENSELEINKEELTVEEVDELVEEIGENIQVDTNVTTQVIPNNIQNKFTDSYNNVKIKNESNRELTDEMVKPDFELNNKKDIIIFHTHTCESYTASEKFNYIPTGNFRTTDLNFTVARVGLELEKYLKNFGYNAIHDQTYHDFPAYSGSYTRSYETVSNLLQTYKNTEIIFDLHRDAIGSDSSYAPTVKIGNEEAAQLMFVIGSNGGGTDHNNWVNNLKTAIKIQEKAEELYPGLFKPMILRNSRYNQNLGQAASIIEVGATGNTMEQCLVSMKYLSAVLNEVLK